MYEFLLILMALDVISGLLKAIKQKKLKSGAIRNGLLKKSGVVLSLILSSILDTLVNRGTPIFQTVMTLIAICDESLSIIENLTILGVSFPKVITSRLNNLEEQDTETTNTKTSK
ncbi:phage holin family protein [Sporolactobacillus pectinivorans]|uniref:phage holin family protein n=1 Tax=Sporolactobacillus pectinivorans TaxID=1591408 RepID=UPI000C26196B